MSLQKIRIYSKCSHANEENKNLVTSTSTQPRLASRNFQIIEFSENIWHCSCNLIYQNTSIYK